MLSQAIVTSGDQKTAQVTSPKETSQPKTVKKDSPPAATLVFQTTKMSVNGSTPVSSVSRTSSNNGATIHHQFRCHPPYSPSESVLQRMQALRLMHQFSELKYKEGMIPDFIC